MCQFFRYLFRNQKVLDKLKNCPDDDALSAATFTVIYPIVVEIIHSKYKYQPHQVLEEELGGQD